MLDGYSERNFPECQYNTHSTEVNMFELKIKKELLNMQVSVIVSVQNGINK